MRKLIAQMAVVVASISILPSCALTDKDSGRAHTRTVRASDGLNLVCDVRGHGETALVFLHGWGGDRHYWKNQVEPFAADYRVVTFDQAGFGQSGKVRNVWSVDSLAADVESVANALQLNRVILIGHSMGGAVALLAAKRMPGRVIGVVGVDTLQSAENRMPDDLRRTLMEQLNTDFVGMVQNLIPSMLPENADPGLRLGLTTKAAEQDPYPAQGLFSDLTSLDPISAFKEARVPIRCINSAGGYALFSPTEIETNRKYADFNAVFIPDVGHYPMLEKPGEFNGKLREVLDSLK